MSLPLAALAPAAARLAALAPAAARPAAARLARPAAALLLLAGCTAPADGPTSDATGDTATGSAAHSLRVTGGYGGGTYAEGQDLHVWAAVDPQNELFFSWRVPHDVAPLASPYEWSSPLHMPDEDLTIAADIASFSDTLSETTFALPSGARDALAWLPADATGLVLFFHGAGYDHTQLRSNAGASLAHRLMYEGLAVISMDSALASTSGTGGWNDDPDDPENADLGAVAELVALLRADGSIGPSTPIAAVGMSSGGQFAHAVGLALPADAVVAFCAPGRESTLAATHAPTAWLLAEGDSTFPSAPEDAAAFAADLDARGVRTLVAIHAPTPLYDERFTRIAGVSEAQSSAIAGELRAAGFVDGADRWVSSGAGVVASFPLDAFSDLSAEQITAVGAEVEIMAADHELYDESADAISTFLRDEL